MFLLCSVTHFIMPQAILSEGTMTHVSYKAQEIVATQRHSFLLSSLNFFICVLKFYFTSFQDSLIFWSSPCLTVGQTIVN